MLVLGVTTYYEDDEMCAGDVLRFDPLATWMGSANWTENARLHVEHGLWSTDPALVFQNYDSCAASSSSARTSTAPTANPLLSSYR